MLLKSSMPQSLLKLEYRDAIIFRKLGIKSFIDALPSLNNVLQSLAIQHGVQPEEGNTRLLFRPLNYPLPHGVHIFELRLPHSGLHRLHLPVVWRNQLSS